LQMSDVRCHRYGEKFITWLLFCVLPSDTIFYCSQ
jgi:hypothetical protein